MSANPFGMPPCYMSDDGEYCAESISQLLQAAPQVWRDWDTAGILEYVHRSPSGLLSCVAGIRPLLPDDIQLTQNLARQPAPSDAMQDGCNIHHAAQLLYQLLSNACLDIARQAEAAGHRFALALSGGLDSALVYALMRQAIGRDFPVYTLVTGLHGYCERAQTLHHAAALGIRDLTLANIAPQDLADALPLAIAAAEVPLFNLHPVARFLLAQKMRRDGIDIMLTGDAADQVFSGADGRNYLPIVGALVRSQKMAVRSPFLAPDVLLFAKRLNPDPNKTILRAAASHVLSQELAICPKIPRLAPEINILQHWKDEAVSRISMLVNFPAEQSTPASRMLWTTLGLLVEHIEESVSCVA